MRHLLWLITALIAVSLSIAVYNWTHPRQQLLNPKMIGKAEGEDQALSLAQMLLDQKRPDQALPIIHSYERYISSATPKGKRWLALFIEASTDLQDGAQLSALWEYFPEAFKDNESAVLLLARYMIATGRTDEYQKLRKGWESKEEFSKDWFLLDADALSSHGDKQEAIKFLKSHQFQGKEDAERLVRLAAAEVKDHPQEAWERLNEAVTLDPKNIVVHLYRARFLEAVGKTQHAIAEYVSLIQLYPQSVMFKDLLADCFLRHDDYGEALALLKTTLTPVTSGALWLKAYFWNKVTVPIDFDWKATSLPVGPLTPLLKYLQELPENVFWNELAFNNVISGKQFLKSEQFTLWLRFLQRLSDGKQKEALELLDANTFYQYSFHPQLENALLQILNYKLKNKLTGEKNISVYLMAKNENSPPATEDSSAAFFDNLNHAAKKGNELSPPLKALLDSRESLTAAFLAARWYEAAVALHQIDLYPSSFPLWMSLEMGRALLHVEGADKALVFLNRQTTDPQVELLKAEIFLGEKNMDRATGLLMALKDLPNRSGEDAAWTLAMLHLEGNEDAQAEEILKRRHDLAQSTRGQELYAKIALARRQDAQAEAIYRKIATASVEAKSYLARSAFEKNDLEQAHKLTVELLQENPNNVVLRSNLDFILQKQKEPSQGSHEQR